MFIHRPPAGAITLTGQPLYKAQQTNIEMACDEYLKCWFQTHYEAAKTIKIELKKLDIEYSKESDDFKITYEKFLVAALVDYLTQNDDKKFLNLLQPARAIRPELLGDDALDEIRKVYPVKDFTTHLTQEKSHQMTAWTAEGGMEVFHSKYHQIHRPASRKGPGQGSCMT